MVSYVRGRGARTLSEPEIIALYLSGEDSATVGAKANCDATTVLYLVKRAGHPVRPRGPRPRLKVLPLTDAEILESYREGLSGPTIADRCGVSAATIYKILKDGGCPCRPPASTAKATAAATRARTRTKRKGPP
jgi:hypothetical protein